MSTDLAEHQWTCPVCTVENLPTASVCIACETPKDPSIAFDLAAEQKNAIEAEAKKQPLVGERVSLDELFSEYRENPNFLRKLEDAKKKYKTFRRVRGDGSCFYRAYLFGVAELLLTDSGLRSAFVSRMEKNIELLLSAGYERFVVEDFYDTFMATLRWIDTEKPSEEQLLAKFQDEELADSLPYYLRLLTAAYIKTNREMFAPLLVGHSSVEDYCRAEIEVPASECDSPQILALSSVLQVPLRVEYLDQSPGGLVGHDFAVQEGAAPPVRLLYRPGHFDIIYPAESAW